MTKIMLQKYCISIYLHKSKIKDQKENILLLLFTIFIMQHTKQRVFLVTSRMRSKSYQVVSQEFSEKFPDFFF